jgi:hypothetical protein
MPTATVRRGVPASDDLKRKTMDFDGAVHRVNNAPELDNCAVAGALDDPAMMHGNGWIDLVAKERAEPRENSILVGSSKPRMPTTSDTKIAASFRVSPTTLRRRDLVSRFGPSGQSLWGASQRRERNVDHWLGHGCTSMLH